MWIEEVLETFYNSKLFQLNRKHLNLIYQFSYCRFRCWVYTMSLWVQILPTDRSVSDVVDPAVEHGLAPADHRNVPGELRVEVWTAGGGVGEGSLVPHHPVHGVHSQPSSGRLVLACHMEWVLLLLLSSVFSSLLLLFFSIRLKSSIPANVNQCLNCKIHH